LTKIPGQSLTGSGSEVASGAPITPGESPTTGIEDPNKSGGIPAADPSQFDQWTANPSALEAYTVHFDFDSSVVKASEESKVTAVAGHLKGQASMALRVEGNCDERGTEEYNRSLGDRRANALREKLAGLGVDPQRIITRSYGEDKPADPGHSETAYAKNRRGDFILLTAPTLTTQLRPTGR
jgi:peptidoglycan-associated lipoprotein